MQVIYPGVTLLDVSGPAQVFGNAGDISADGSLAKGPAEYDVTLVSATGGDVPTDVGISLSTACIHDVATDGIDTLLICGGIGVLDALRDTALVDWFRNAAQGSRRAGSTCMGAFLLAETGLCNGSEITTHWRWARELERRYPDVNVSSDRIFIKGDRFWSSAGVTSGIDMALAMVQEDLGHAVSIELAKALLVYFRRPGNQSQFSSRLQAQSRDGADQFAELVEWIEENLQGDLSVEALAQQQGMSPRNFARVFSHKIGMSPAKYVERVRVDTAKNMLSGPASCLARVSHDVGFGCEKSMKRAFLRVIEMTPGNFMSQYRE